MCVAPPRYVCLAAGQPCAPHGAAAGYSRLRPSSQRRRVGDLAGLLGGVASGEADGARRLPATTLSPHAMQLALHRRLRLPLPLRPKRCGPSPGCGGLVDVFGNHALACPRTGLLARRAKIVERAWVRVAREAVGADGQVVPQQWLSNTTAPGVAPDDRRRLTW